MSNHCVTFPYPANAPERGGLESEVLICADVLPEILKFPDKPTIVLKKIVESASVEVTFKFDLAPTSHVGLTNEMGYLLV